MNQTLVRSINTAIVGVLPVGAILFIGAFMLGAGTLQDLSLSLFVGILVGMFGTLFVSAPLYATLRLGEAKIREHTAKVENGDFKDDEEAEESDSEGSEDSGNEGSEDSAEAPAKKSVKKSARATIEIHRVNVSE